MRGDEYLNGPLTGLSEMAPTGPIGKKYRREAMNIRMTGPWADDENGMVVTHNGPNAADIFERALRNMAGQRGGLEITDEPGMEVDEPSFIDMLGAENVDDALYGDGRQRTAANIDDAWNVMQKGGMTPKQFIRILKNSVKRGIPIPKEYNDILIDDVGVDPYSL